MIFAAGFAVAGRAERAGEVDPVETQDHVGAGDRLARPRPQQDAGRVDVQRMVGRETRRRP